MIVVQFVKEKHRLDPDIGGAKLHHMYLERFGRGYEHMVGRDKMEAIISKNGLNVRQPRRRSRTTDSTHGLPTYSDLTRELIPERKNQLWVTDSTYIPTWLSDNKATACNIDNYINQKVGTVIADIGSNS